MPEKPLKSRDLFNILTIMKKSTSKFFLIIFFSLFIITPILKTNAFDLPVENDCVSPAWRFWGESIGCAWQASNGHIANALPDGKTCCALRTHAQYYFGIKFNEWQSCDPIPCPENVNP